MYLTSSIKYLFNSILHNVACKKKHVKQIATLRKNTLFRIKILHITRTEECV